MTRIFANFAEAINELRRDLSELSVKLLPTTWQGKSVAGNPDFTTNELQNYQYTVTAPHLADLSPSQPWADLEFLERLSAFPVNPGTAWESRREVWDELLEENLKFSYNYNERIRYQLEDLIHTLRKTPDSRQVFLSVWEPCIDSNRFEKRRVPCSLGYYFQCRGGALNMTYLQRSCDFVTHYQNDVYLAVRLMEYIAFAIPTPPGMFTHWIGSLHVFEKDVRGVF